MIAEELRELDARIAREVFGGTNIQDIDGYGHWVWNSPEGWVGFHGDHYSSDCLPFFSSDIAAAWMVVEKMRERHLLMELEERIQEPPFVCFFHARLSLELMGHGSADTAPLAIALAALATVEMPA